MQTVLNATLILITTDKTYNTHSIRHSLIKLNDQISLRESRSFIYIIGIYWAITGNLMYRFDSRYAIVPSVQFVEIVSIAVGRTAVSVGEPASKASLTNDCSTTSVGWFRLVATLSWVYDRCNYLNVQFKGSSKEVYFMIARRQTAVRTKYNA